MKTKLTLLLITSLLIGFLIGFLASGRMTKTKVEKIKSWNTREGFRTHLFDIMEADEMQRAELKVLMDSFSDLHWKMVNQHWENQNVFFDSLYNQLEKRVTKEQFDKLIEHRDKVRAEKTQKKAQRDQQK
ncbi:MAG TPA: hypothetical protein PK939_03375 [Bacteroidales bacterium]|nr:hypothetical protein [Bacteroidales bacterium]HQQ11695.1 hypothetical protein [Bacteroidales bacterium]